MTEKTPVLIADARSLDVGEATPGRIAPAAWIASFAVHAAAVLGFLDRTDRLEPHNPPEIVVELVIDLPLREVSAVPRQALTSLPVPLDPEEATPVAAMNLLAPREAGSPLAAVPADAAAPVASAVTLPAVTETDAAPAIADPDIRSGLASAHTLLPQSDGGVLSPVESPAARPVAAAAPPGAIAASDEAATSLPPAALPSSPMTAVYASVPATPLAAFPEPLTATHATKSPEPIPPFAASAGEQLRPAAAPPPALMQAGGGIESQAGSPAAEGAAPAVPPNAPAAVVTRPVQSNLVEAALPAPAPTSAVALKEATKPAQSRSPVQPVPAAAAPSPELLPPARDAPPHAPPIVREPNPVEAALLPRPMHARDPRRALSEAVLMIECGRVEADFDAESGVVRLSGHVRSLEEREMLSKRLIEVTGARQVIRTDLHLVGEPYCRMLELLNRPELRRSDDQSQNIAAIAQPTQSGVLTLKAGMPLALQLTGPEYPSYVYVDYFTADGRVYHLLPTASLSDHRLRPGERLTIGGRNGRGVKATIGPPFGLDIVVAFASDAPLWARARPVAESADAYLEDLAEVVAEEHRRHPTRRIEYSYFLIQTSEK